LNRACCSQDCSHQFITKKNRWLTGFIYDFIGAFSENCFKVVYNEKSSYIDINGIQITSSMYYFIDELFNEGLARVVQSQKQSIQYKKLGMINTNGKLVIPSKYQYLDDCSEGFIQVTRLDYKSRYIDKNNNIIIPFGQYDYGSSFHCVFVKVYVKTLGWFYIDRTGKVLELKV